jgi:hypothetical protein
VDHIRSFGKFLETVIEGQRNPRELRKESNGDRICMKERLMA